MFIPKTMKTEMAKVFYDKEIHILDRRTETDAEGGVKTTGHDVRDTFKGHVNFSNCEKLQKEYGLDYVVNVSITTNCNSVNKSDILSYNTVLYEVKGIYTRDSHKLILGTIWRT